MSELCTAPARSPTPWYLHPYFAAALTALGAFATSWALRHLDPQGVLRWVAALLAVPPSAFLVYTFVRWIRGLDELQHRIVFEAVGIAFVTSILAAIALEGLQKAGILTRFRWEDAWMAMVFLYVAGYAWARRRYR